MRQSWEAIAARLDGEAGRFVVAARNLEDPVANGRSTDAAWKTYVKRKRDLHIAIDSVVKFAPKSSLESKAKLDVAAKLLNLCHSIDESWLESEAERIAPDLRAMADVFLDS